jgi:lipopolysaccharide export system permease protein
VPGNILQRYIWWELSKVFVMSLIAITSIFVMAGVVQEASQLGLGPEHILKIIPLLIPGTLPYTVPATTLFSVSVVYGRMAHDNEITAIKAAGIPMRVVLMPGFLLSGMLCVTMFFLYRDFIPRTHHELRNIFWTEFEDIIYARLRRELLFNESRVPFAIWVKEVQGRVLIQPTFKKRDASGNYELVAQAAEAEMHFDLPGGIVHIVMLHGEVWREADQSSAIFDQQQVFDVPLPNLGENKQARARARTATQIDERRGEARQELAGLRADLEKAAKAPPSVPGSVDQVKVLQFKIEGLEREICELDIEEAMRPAVAFGCFFFALIGAPVAIWFHRSDYLSNFVICFLPIVIIYYPLQLMAINLSKKGTLPPLVGMWLCNAVLGCVGLWLLRTISKR